MFTRPFIAPTFTFRRVKMVEAADIDWEAINAKLPYERSAEAKEQRRELFKQFDPNSNGYLSLAEVKSYFNNNRFGHIL